MAPLGQVGGGPPAPVLRRHVFSSGVQGVLVLAGWSRGPEGLGGCVCPLGGEERKERAHFHTTFFVKAGVHL